MRSSSKSRNRGRNANRRGNNGGSVINRVFDSAGPEGKVRGTPQQIIDKYTSLAHDSQLSGDRVSAENFQQHAEHYQRILSEAQKEISDKQIDTFNSNSNNFNKSDFISQNNLNSDNKEDELKKDSIDGKAIVEENSFVRNNKLDDCKPLEKTQRKKTTKSEKDSVISKNDDETDQINSDL